LVLAETLGDQALIGERRRMLILCKTYPSPSSRYAETSCVAAMDESGALVRLFPVPFRLITDDQQFRKWQWISARVRKAPEDHRPESYRISVDTIETEGDPIPTTNFWAQRRAAIGGIEEFDDFADLDRAREDRGVTLGLLRPAELLDFEIKGAGSAEWSDDEIAKLMQAQNQGNLWDQDDEQRSVRLLRKLPFDFHYRYRCGAGDRASEYRHKIVDWEAGALYWNICRRPQWEAAMRHKFLTEFQSKDLLFLMGTIHRFPKQWLIVSVIYPPKPPVGATDQAELF
jgi:hypothetical protein